ncbi:MAG: hypothetical protein QM441_04095 [Synergistota bacterium]|jgi:hypothetical protein|nr:hypothetical protein [Synergistota bacterium]
MAISTAVQKGSSVYVYNEKNQQLCVTGGTLEGYTSTTYSVRKGSTIYTYNERCQQVSAHSV